LISGKAHRRGEPTSSGCGISGRADGLLADRPGIWAARPGRLLSLDWFGLLLLLLLLGKGGRRKLLRLLQ
jgi:hypothetical protein